MVVRMKFGPPLRSVFLTACLAVGNAAPQQLAPDPIDAVLRAGVDEHGIPGVVAMVATPDAVIYKGVFGKREVAGQVSMTEDTIFRIYSMTKPLTSVATMQLVEQGKLKLDAAAGKWLPPLASPNILEGFENGQPKMRPAVKAITVRHLLTHTSGLVYSMWDKNLRDYQTKRGDSTDLNPLLFEPGTRWEYGTSTDQLGKLVEAVSGLTLEDYFQKNILQPLDMRDTSFNVPAEKVGRIASLHQRQTNGSLLEQPRKAPAPAKSFSGGGGLYSTAGDYLKFMQMLLRGGAAGKTRILQAKTVAMMAQNQIGVLQAGRLTSVMPELSNDVDFHPGFVDKFGLGFLINPVAYQGGRSKGSLAWAGLANTYFWIDPGKNVCAAILMQILPFVDKEGIALLRNFEQEVYRGW
jgi:methyl acetate hydrolase